jgi:hypothetical protein
MKTLTPILIILMFSLCYCALKKDKNSLTKDNIKGRVSTLTESHYSAIERFGETQKGGLEYKYIYKYDTNGSQIELNGYNSDGSSRGGKYTSKYDAKGNQIEVNGYSNIPGIIDGRERKTIYKYDTNGNKIEESWYDPDGSLSLITIFKYDSRGNQIEANCYNSDGSLLISRSTYKYDSRGNKIEDNFCFPYPVCDSGDKYTFKYDSRGNQIEENRYNSDGSLEYKHTFKYDEYDKTGNWVRKIKFRNDKPLVITERKIEYYTIKYK